MHQVNCNCLACLTDSTGSSCLGSSRVGSSRFNLLELGAADITGIEALSQKSAVSAPVCCKRRFKHHEHCHCIDCAGVRWTGSKCALPMHEDSAGRFSEAEALALVDELFAMNDQEQLDLFLGKLVKNIDRTASVAVREVGTVAQSIRLGKIGDVAFKLARGDLAGVMLPLLPASMQKTVRAFSIDPFSRFALQTTRAALRGENLLRAVQVAAKSGIENMQERMRFAAMVAPFVPGVGSGVAAALGAASALAGGEPITKALMQAARSAVPGGAIAQAAFDLGLNMASGKSLGQAALATARKQIPGGLVAQAAFDAALALSQGKKIQDAAFAAAGKVLPKSPFAADALSFTRRIAAGEDIRKAALSSAGNALVKRLERGGIALLAAAPQRLQHKTLRHPMPIARNTELEVAGFSSFASPVSGASGAADSFFPASGNWLRRGRHIVLYYV